MDYRGFPFGSFLADWTYQPQCANRTADDYRKHGKSMRDALASLRLLRSVPNEIASIDISIDSDISIYMISRPSMF
jgi:hypothetical protein